MGGQPTRLSRFARPPARSEDSITSSAVNWPSRSLHVRALCPFAPQMRQPLPPPYSSIDTPSVRLASPAMARRASRARHSRASEVNMCSAAHGYLLHVQKVRNILTCHPVGSSFHLRFALRFEVLANSTTEVRNPLTVCGVLRLRRRTLLSTNGFELHNRQHRLRIQQLRPSRLDVSPTGFRNCILLTTGVSTNQFWLTCRALRILSRNTRLCPAHNKRGYASH